jgi:hypothetical protein
VKRNRKLIHIVHPVLSLKIVLAEVIHIVAFSVYSSYSTCRQGIKKGHNSKLYRKLYTAVQSSPIIRNLI